MRPRHHQLYIIISYSNSFRVLLCHRRSLNVHRPPVWHLMVKMVSGTAAVLTLLLLGPAAVAAGTLRGKLIRQLRWKVEVCCLWTADPHRNVGFRQLLTNRIKYSTNNLLLPWEKYETSVLVMWNNFNYTVLLTDLHINIVRIIVQ